jgi:hypothetical protein
MPIKKHKEEEVGNLLKYRHKKRQEGILPLVNGIKATTFKGGEHPQVVNYEP